MPGELLTDTWLSYDHKVLSIQSFQLFFLTLSSTPGTLLIKDAQTDSLLFGRALHQYHRGHGFKSCTGLKIFFRSYFNY